ncbi:MAG: hypothetical protein ACD_51C00365G0003 [uncultured bacterium]|nr:MAG: hypothetical protein ACD_51C00365G0003 [uncultured bacterium]
MNDDFKQLGFDMKRQWIRTLEQLEDFMSEGGEFPQIMARLQKQTKETNKKSLKDVLKMKAEAIRDLQQDDLSKNKIIKISPKETLINQKLITTGSDDTVQYLVVIAVFSLADKNGFCSYEKIEEFLESNGQTKKSGRAMNKRILTALAGAGRFIKTEGGNRNITDNIKIISGKGVQLQRNM